MAANFLDAKDGRGRTALHHAVIRNDQTQIARILNSKPAPDVNIRDNQGGKGLTPLWYAACQTHNPLVVKALKDAGAQVDIDLAQEVIRESRAKPLDPNIKAIRNVLGLK